MSITNLPLYDDPYYTYSIDLEGEAYEFTFRWNDRAHQWMMTITDSDGLDILRNIPVVPAYPLLSQFALEKPSGEIYLLSVSELERTNPIPNPRDINQSHRLVYFSPDEE